MNTRLDYHCQKYRTFSARDILSAVNKTASEKHNLFARENWKLQTWLCILLEKGLGTIQNKMAIEPKLKNILFYSSLSPNISSFLWPTDSIFEFKETSSARGTTIKARNGCFWGNLSILIFVVVIWMKSSVVHQLRFTIIDEVLPQHHSYSKECMAIWRYVKLYIL